MAIRGSAFKPVLRAGAVVLLVALGVVPFSTAQAAPTFTVTTTVDAPAANPSGNACASTLPGNPCTLRAAVQAVNSNHGGAIRLKAEGTYRLTVAGAPGEDAAASGDLDINAAVVSIVNVSADRVVIDGNGTDRVFDIGPQAPAQVSIAGVTIRNGVVFPPEIGGGVRVSPSSALQLSDVTVTANTAGFGGGVGFTFPLTPAPVPPPPPGSISLTNVTVSNNTAAVLGGGLLNSQALFAHNVVVRGNRALIGGGGVSVGFTQMDQVTIRNNAASLAGGGFSNAGPAQLNSIVVRGNASADIDGGLGNAAGEGTVPDPADPTKPLMVLTNALITDNTAATINGGFASPGNAILNNVTISNNAAGSFAGASILGFVNMTNVTISGNRASPGGVGGGLANANVTNLINVTVNGNSAGAGGGIANGAAVGAVFLQHRATIETLLRHPLVIPPTATVLLSRTIVANSAPGTNCLGTMTSLGFNISSDASCSFAGPGDRNSTNPRLGSLANNGGPRLGAKLDDQDDGGAPTLTHALRRGSPAIDAVTTGCPPPTTDQRGVARPQGPRCDIGAFELAPNAGE